VTSLPLTSTEVVDDPYPLFAEARRQASVQWHDGLSMWLTFTHAAANSVLRARTLGRIWTPRSPAEPMPAFALIHVHSLLESEPPQHTRLRRSSPARSHAVTSNGCGRRLLGWQTNWRIRSPTKGRTDPSST
jgi:cytochrome P450